MAILSRALCESMRPVAVRGSFDGQEVNLIASSRRVSGLLVFLLIDNR